MHKVLAPGLALVGGVWALIGPWLFRSPATADSCAAIETSEDIGAVCSACGSTGVDHAGGGELTLESVEYVATAEPVASAAG